MTTKEKKVETRDLRRPIFRSHSLREQRHKKDLQRICISNDMMDELSTRFVVPLKVIEATGRRCRFLLAESALHTRCVELLFGEDNDLVVAVSG